MAIDIRLLESFHAVVEKQSVTGAAQILNLTQPAVSVQIGKLEERLGLSLFERIGGRLRLNSNGRTFYEESANALGAMERLSQIAERLRSGFSETVFVACNPSSSITLMPSVMRDTLTAGASSRIRLITRSSPYVVSAFEAGGVDIGVAETPVHSSDVMLRRHEIPCVAIVPSTHDYASKTVLTPEDLVSEPFIGASENRPMGHLIRKAFADSGVIYDPAIECDDSSTACGLVSKGAGISIVDLNSARYFQSDALVIVDFAPQITYGLSVFSHTPALIDPLVGNILKSLNNRLAASSRYQMDQGP